MTATATETAPSSTAEVREQVHDAAAHRRSVRIVGGGSWLDANRPVRADNKLVIRPLAGIVEYEPGDLTLTARAGTTLDEIAHAAAAHGQWLALDPIGDPTRSTLGATIATASSGALAHSFGTPRDMTLGVEFVAGTGDVVRGGGRVVKNVAGFDLTRLLTGSWGSLGVITEATVRLRALLSVQCTLAIETPATADGAERVRATLRGLPFIPASATLLDANLGRRLSLEVHAMALLVRLGGNDEAVRAQREQLRGLGDAREEEAEVWRRLQTTEPESVCVVRLSALPSRFAATWQYASRLVEGWPDAYCHGDPGRGIVRVVLPVSQEHAAGDVADVLAIPYDGTRVFERLPAHLWASLAPSAMHGRLQRGIKAAFDPHSVLNPGILGEMS